MRVFIFSFILLFTVFWEHQSREKCHELVMFSYCEFISLSIFLNLPKYFASVPSVNHLKSSPIPYPMFYSSISGENSAYVSWHLADLGVGTRVLAVEILVLFVM